MNDKISVLMGVYNAKSNIDAAVMTIERQTEQNIEYVICDDGSTDGTYEILKEYARKYSNIRLLHNKKNRGLAYSLNRCFKASTGGFIARMDSDDRCMDNRFERQKAFLMEHPEYDLVGSLMILVDEYGKETYSKVKAIQTAKVFPLGVPFAHPTVLMRREVLETLGGYAVEKYTRRCEDLELWYRFMAHGMKGYNLQEYLYIKSQGIDDYKRRKVIHGVEMFFIHLRGLRLIHAPWYRYPLAVKPIISASVPKKIMKAYHGIKFRKARG